MRKIRDTTKELKDENDLIDINIVRLIPLESFEL